jgi:hypothetical protein
MSRKHSRRLTPRTVLLALVSLVLLAPLTTAEAQPPQSTVPGKTFAAYRFGWYPLGWADHFDTKRGATNQPVGPAPAYWKWKDNGAGIVLRHHGMLSLETEEGSSGDLSATLRLPRRYKAYGRWEIRFRARRMQSSGGRDYTVAAELVPALVSEACGSQNIALASFRLSGHSSTHYIRTLPNRQFTKTTGNLRLPDYWHTYAVEVSRRWIASFVDGRARSVERRPEARSGVPLTLKFSLTGVPGERMNRTKAQIDTVRYFSLKSKPKRPYRARGTTLGTYRGC